MLRRIYHVIIKVFCFFLFGLGCVVFMLIVKPTLFLFTHSDVKRIKKTRFLYSRFFYFFTRFMSLFRIVKITSEDMEGFLQGETKIICSNHPSLLDIVLLIGIIPNTNCIVKSELLKNPLLSILLTSVYIPNSLDVNEVLAISKNSLDGGEHLILFPEGTRTPKDGSIDKIHRSAAQLAIRSGHDILVVRIDCSKDSGLAKSDKIWDSPHKGVIEYKLSVRKTIKTDNYKGLSTYKAAKKLTSDLETAMIH